MNSAVGIHRDSSDIGKLVALTAVVAMLGAMLCSSVSARRGRTTPIFVICGNASFALIGLLAWLSADSIKDRFRGMRSVLPFYVLQGVLPAHVRLKPYKHVVKALTATASVPQV